MSDILYHGYKMRQIRSIVEVTTPSGDKYPVIANLPEGIGPGNADTRAFRSDLNRIILSLGKKVE